MPQPSTSIPNWASDSAFTSGIETGIAPTLAYSNSEIAQGLRPGKVVARKLNWLFRNLSQWLYWHEERITNIVPKITVLNTAGVHNYSKPTGCVFISGVLVGGGGGGDAYDDIPGGGGGAGEIMQFSADASTWPAAVSVTVGAGGLGAHDFVGSGRPATNGQQSSISTGSSVLIFSYGGVRGTGSVGGSAWPSGGVHLSHTVSGGSGGSSAGSSGQAGNLGGLLTMESVGGAGQSVAISGHGGQNGGGIGGGGGGAGGASNTYDIGLGGRGGGAGGPGYAGYDISRGFASIGHDATNTQVLAGDGAAGGCVITAWCLV